MITISEAPDGGCLLTDPLGNVYTVAPGIAPADVVATVLAVQSSLPAALQGVQRVTDVVAFGATYIAAVKAIVNDIETLRTLNDRVAQDSTLFANYLTSPGARTDLVVGDLTNAGGAVTQLLFTFDSGAPTQKSFLFKLL